MCFNIAYNNMNFVASPAALESHGLMWLTISGSTYWNNHTGLKDSFLTLLNNIHSRLTVKILLIPNIDKVLILLYDQ